MRLLKGMMAWLLTIAIVLGICPNIVQAAYPNISQLLAVGESREFAAGSTVTMQNGTGSLRYYSSKDSQEVLWTDDAANSQRSLRYMTGEYPDNWMTFTDLHMAPKVGQMWVVERLEDIIVPVTDASAGSSGSTTYEQYRLYPADTYYAAEYDLDGGQWNNTNWIDTVKGVQHGVWKSGSAIPVKSSLASGSSDWDNWNYGGHGEKLWSVYDGYEVTLPSAIDVTKADKELSGWQINQTPIVPGAPYTVSVVDAVYSTQLRQDKVDIKAIWAPKTIGTQQVNAITKDSATFIVDYQTCYPVTVAGFVYKEASATNWIDVPVVANNGELTATVTGLNSGTEYEVQAYLENMTGRIENTVTSFKTYRPQSVGNATVATTTLNTASFSAPYVCDVPGLQAAFEYRKVDDTYWTTVTAQANAIIETLTASVSGLESNTAYQVRAVLQAGSEVSRSSAVTNFKTKQESAVGTVAVTGVTAQAATFKVDYVTEEPLLDQVFEYRKLGDSIWYMLRATVNGNEFTATIDSLSSNTTYEVRGYMATTIDGYQGSAVSFTTPKKTQSVGFVTISDVTTTAASFKLSYVSDDALTQQGFSYRKMGDSNWTQLSATVTGTELTATVTDLTRATAYEVKGYIETAAGETQTQIVGFATLKNPQTITPVGVINITTTAASFKASYTSDDTLLQQGFRYKKSTDNDSSWKEIPATVSGGDFTATVSGLASGTAYDVKGYIQTAAGETQTQVVSFTTVKSSSGGSDNSSGSDASDDSSDSDDSDSSSNSGSSSGSGSTGGSNSAGATSNTGSSTAQQVSASIDKAIEQGTTPTLAVDASYKAQVPVEALEAIAKAGQELVVQSGSIGVAFNVQAVEMLLGNNNTATPLQITTAPIAPTTLEQITKQFSQAQGETVLGGSDLTLELSVKSTQQLDTFVEPLDIKLDLSNVDVKDASKFTLVRYETQKDGSVTAVKLGGKYDEKTKSLSAKTNEPGLYGVMEVENLTQITLKIDDNEIELNGKNIRNDVAPKIIDGLTMMPLRSIVESLGATVQWDDTLKQAIVMLNGKRIVVGKEQGLLLKEKEGRTLVPVRFISEELGANVLWIPSTRQVQIVR